MLAYYMREAYLLLEEGASVPQIDNVLTDFGLPVGPYGMQDIAGIDVGARIRQYLASIGKSRAEGPQSEIPDQIYEMGRYGQKPGAGWYKYDAPGSRNRTPDPLIEELANKAAAKRGIVRRAIDDAEIIARITTALANEGRACSRWLAMRQRCRLRLWIRLPRYRGGPMFYATRRSADRPLARRNMRASATTGNRRHCSNGWSRKDALLQRGDAAGRSVDSRRPPEEFWISTFVR
jgi:3-hydroxyacyl-CoA dehydrogenase